MKIVSSQNRSYPSFIPISYDRIMITTYKSRLIFAVTFFSKRNALPFSYYIVEKREMCLTERIKNNTFLNASIN